MRNAASIRPFLIRTIVLALAFAAGTSLAEAQTTVAPAPAQAQLPAGQPGAATLPAPLPSAQAPIAQPTVPAPAATPTGTAFTPVPCPVRPWESVDPVLTPLPGARVLSGRYDGGVYAIEIPEKWNGELVLWAHGTVGVGTPDGHRLQVLIPDLRRHWIESGFAWAASSYRCNGSIFGVGLLDTMALRGIFTRETGGRLPSRVYLTGRSLGGRITLLGLRQFPEAFAGGLAMCTAGQETNDLRVAFRAAAEYVTGIRIEDATRSQDLARIEQALGTPMNYTALGRVMANLQVMMTGGPRPFVDEGLAQRFLTNVSDGVNFIPGELGLASTNVETMYPALDAVATADLNRRVRRIPADPVLRGAGTPYVELRPFDGLLTRPLLTLAGTGDLQTPVSQQQALKRSVMAAGTDQLLVQRLIRSAGHCAFSIREQARAFDDLARWVRDGKRPSGDDVLGDLRNAGLKFTDPLRTGDPSTLATQ